MEARQFVSGVSAVEVYASVTDAGGEPVQGLTAADFEVRENGERQTIATFVEGDFPLSLAIGVDRSFSMRGDRLALAKRGARALVTGLGPRDEAMIVAIGSEVEIAAPLSGNRASQLEALDRLEAFGTTGLYDAIVRSIDAVQGAKGRRALILLSDGDDRYSTVAASEVLEIVRRSDVMMYPVAMGRTRPAVFAELATLTGGRSFHVTDPARLPETLQRIVRELHRQYLIGYTPARPIVPGHPEWRGIKVTVKGAGLIVRARDGYMAK
jgi:VWFA-related protein